MQKQTIMDQPAPAADENSAGWAWVFENFERVRKNPLEWEDEGIEAPTVATIDAAITVARWFQKSGRSAPMRPVPGGDGTVAFSWREPNRTETVEIFPDK